MKNLALLLLLAVSVFAGDTWVEPYCMHDLKAVGAPTLPGASDNLTVFANGLDAGTVYRIVLVYSVNGQPPISSTIDVVANESGAFASFPVTEVKAVSVVKWSVRKL